MSSYALQEKKRKVFKCSDVDHSLCSVIMNRLQKYVMVNFFFWLLFLKSHLKINSSSNHKIKQWNILEKTENYKTSFEHVIKILMGCLKMWIKVIKARHDISK